MTLQDKLVLGTIGVVTIIMAVFLPGLGSNSVITEDVAVEAVPAISFNDAVANPLVDNEVSTADETTVEEVVAETTGANITFSGGNDDADATQNNSTPRVVPTVADTGNSGSNEPLATIIDTPDASNQSSGLWFINAAIFNNPANADQMHKRIQSFGYSPKINQLQKSDGTFYRIELGPYQDKDTASKASVKLKSDIGFPGSIFQK